MSVTFKIVGGTLPSRNLCESCERAQFMVDDTNRSIVYCDEMSRLVTRKIMQCNMHRPLGTRMLGYRLKSQAWEIDVAPDGTVVFEDPKGNEVRYLDGEKVQPKRGAGGQVKITVRRRVKANPKSKKALVN